MILSLAKWLVIISILSLVPNGGFVVIGLSILFFFMGKVDEFDLVLLLALISIVSNSLSGMGDYSILRFILIPIILFKYGFDSIKKVVFGSKYHLLFILYLSLNVVFISIDSLYSAYKLPTFLLLLMVAYTGANVGINRRLALINLEGLFLAVMIFSFFVIPFESISYARNGVGFQGVLTHPNIFAVFLAPYACLLFYRVLTKISLLDAILLTVVIVFLSMSQSRTGVFSVFLATIAMLIINSDFKLHFSKFSLLVFIPFTFVFLNYTSEISMLLDDFLTKGGNAESFLESIALSRQGLFSDQLSNIEKNPFFGIGFMIPSDYSHLALFLSAAEGNTYEKGNSIMAILEELGIVGFIIFLMFILKLVFSIRDKKKQRSGYFFMAIAILITTMGEATLFSIGGIGLFVWTLVFLNFNNNI